MEDNKTVSVAEVVAQPIGQEQLRQALSLIHISEPTRPY